MPPIGALFNLAVRHHQSGQLADAIALYRQILQAEPGHADALNNLGYALFELGQVDEALAYYRQVLLLHPNHVGAHINLGFALYGQRKFADAIDSYRQALVIDPDHTEAHNNLGMALDEQGRLAEAIACYREALRCTPDHADALNNLGIALVSQGELGEGLAYLELTLRAAPGHAMALWNRSCLRLLHGDYESGWRDYEQRWHRPGVVPRTFTQPRWDGTPLAGKTLLLYAEQGLGDTIQFGRFARLAKKMNGRILLECQPALERVLTGVAGVDRLVSQGSPPPFDVQLPLMSLGSIFSITVDTIPREIPYLRADPKLVEYWRLEIAKLSPGVRDTRAVPAFKIGILWQGNPAQADDRYRSVPLAQFAPLAKVPGVSLISLQVGLGREQLAEAPFPIIDLGSRFDPNSLHDLAAVLPNLDLVVTVCSSVAHLAGALGITAWVALKFVPYWCWLLERADSPWYPTLRLFRQNKPGAWDDVFERIANAVAARLATAHNRRGIAFSNEQRFAEAADCYRQALRLNPRDADAHNNLGLAFAEEHRLAEAALCYRQAVRERPDFAEAYYNLGLALFGLRQSNEAIRFYRQTLQLNPNHLAALNNLGNALKDQGQFTEAAACFERALQIDPHSKIALFNRSLLRLLHGDFAGGWPDYEHRWAEPGLAQRTFKQPRWDGSPLEGKAILVYAEQGLGDSLQFVRYLPLVQRCGGKVLFECQTAVCKLLARFAGIEKIIPAGTPLPPFDVQVPLLSLPKLLGTTLATIPAPVPYLTADARLVDYWHGELASRLPRVTGSLSARELVIGIAWQGNLGHRNDHYRSIPLMYFETLTHVPNVRLTSLQVGAGTQQLASARFAITDLGSGFDPASFEDLAAAIMNLDLIVTADTAVAHLAGALGRPVWVALPVGPDWRWQLQRSDSPWYPTMRLFRQTTLGDWRDVFERMAEDAKKGVGSQE